MRGQRREAPATPSTTPAARGAHFLRGRRLAADLVRAAGVGPDDLVFDLGAGLGALTAPLAATGATVVAVERDPRYQRRLARRFAGQPRVRLIAGDVLAVPLPRRAFRVVANLPFGVTTAMLRRLLDPPSSRLVAADVIVARGAATALTDPDDGETRWWASRYEMQLARRLSPACFVPPPSVDAAVLRIRVRQPVLTPPALRALRTMLVRAAAAPRRPVNAVVRGVLPAPRLHRAANEAALPLRLAAGEVSPAQWHQLAAALLPEHPHPQTAKRVRKV